MPSQLTVRLPDDLERDVADIARKLRLRRSDIVRLALEKYLQESEIREPRIPFKNVGGLIGTVSSGLSDLGASHREHLRKRIRKDA